MTDVTYWAGWVDAPDAVELTGDNLEAAQRASRVQDLREERAAEERRAELEDRAEALMRNAPTLAEVLERVERQTKAEDWRTAKADAKALEELLASGGVEKDPADLTDLRRESVRKARKAAEAKAVEREQANQEHRKELEAAGHYFPNHKPAFTAERGPQRPVRPFLPTGGVA
jgi:hypothetical protein